jgi:hypothetical protein
VFDKRIAHAARDHGILHEAMRTWPGARRSDHPDAGVLGVDFGVMNGKLLSYRYHAKELQKQYTLLF